MIDRDAKKAELALLAFDPLFDALRQAQTGKWSAWYFGESLVGVEQNRDLVRTLLAELLRDLRNALALARLDVAASPHARGDGG